MVLDAVSNFVRGNTDAAIASGDTTISVADASIFPDPATDGEFNVVIWNASNFPRPDQDSDAEIVRVTGRDTGADELTVVRGQETTSDVAHPEGSAVHLSPTAKMFTDIEDTFTTEAEAEDAAPVQSVFDRVGDVVAETGDYAATQISNFGSEVLSSIDGSSISPSDITGLWDGSVVTADVDNESVSTEKASIGQVVGRLLNGNTDQTFEHNTFTQFEYDTVDTEDSDIVNVDVSNDEITVLENGGYYIIHRFRFGSSSGWSTGDELDVRMMVNASVDKADTLRERKIGTGNQTFLNLSFKELSVNDTIHVECRIRADDGTSKGIQSADFHNELTVVRLG